MISKKVGWPGPLSELLPGAPFRERHLGVVPADPDTTWRALQRLRWSDVAGGRSLMLLRGIGFGGRAARPCLDLFRDVAHFEEAAPRELGFVVIGRPWLPVPASRPVTSMDQAACFAEPGWLVYGMDWVLTGLPDGRTLVETHTICRPTSTSARVAFGAYWAVIRPFSGLLRRGMIAALARST